MAVAILVIIATICGVFGLALASNATAGTAVVAFACLLGIFARLWQASVQHQENRERLDTIARRLGSGPSTPSL